MNTASTEADNVRNMDEEVEDEEEEGKRVMAIIKLQSAPLPFPQKMNFPGLSHYFSAVSWCGRSNLIACATETCARDPSSDQRPAFWIPVHLFDSERPSEHILFNVTADSPNDWLQFLEWSPVACEPALLVCTSNGRVTIWSQPMQGSSNVARTINCWTCEHEWREEQAATVKWVTGPSPYQFSPTSSVGAPSPKSLEERFLAHAPRSTVRWPNFLCICSILYSGSVQLHWRQWPLVQTNRSPRWFSTSKTVVGAGPSGLFAADAIVNTKGSLIVAGSPVGTPSTVIIWEIGPWIVNSASGSQPLKYGMPVQTQLAFGPPTWPGVAPLAAYLMSWQEKGGSDTNSGQSQTENKENAVGPLLQCTPISNLSAYLPPDASTLTTWGSGISSVAFDPSKAGTSLHVLVVEGYFISPERPDDGAAVTGWRCQCWESSSQPVAIHPLFETGTYPTASHSTVMSWNAVSDIVMPQRAPSTRPTTGNGIQTDINGWKKANPFRPVNPRCISRVFFSREGEFVLSFLSGEIYIFSGSSKTLSESLSVPADRALPPALAFSPTSLCLAMAWHSKKSDSSHMKLLSLDPPSSVASNQVVSSTMERHIADRFWWGLVNSLDRWDIIAYIQHAKEDGAVTVPRVAAVLDADFHALPNIAQREYYSVALDMLKCRMLESTEAADGRALILDMQARLLLDMLAKGVESSLINPSSLVDEPWKAFSETLQGLGPDAMAVDPPLVPLIQGYVDSILDLASHFLTRLRRYASFCRTLASHAAASPSSLPNARPGVNLSNGGPLATPGGQGSATQSSSGNSTGTAGVQAWVQGAIAKISNSAEPVSSTGSNTGITPTTPLPLSVSSATFPGMPAVRLIGDCQFLHRLCRLLFFCLIFRKRQLPRFVGGPRPDSTTGSKPAGGLTPKNEDMSTSSAVSRSTTGAANVKVEDGARVASNKPEEAANPRPARVGSGNAGQGYTSEAVKYLFLVLVDLCKRTSMLAHPMPKSQVGSENPIMKLHYVDGQYTVTPEVVEASLAPHMQQLPRPHGADAAGLLMRELELQPPAEDWNRKAFTFGSWSGAMQTGDVEDEQYGFWPRKRKYAERDAALGVRTAIGLGCFASFMGARRDVITGVWTTSQHGMWHMCLNCGRKTASLAIPTLGTLPAGSTPASQLSTSANRETWWTGRWAANCPMCGGKWARIV